MNSIYNDILQSAEKGQKLLAILIDPDKMRLDKVPDFVSKINSSIATHIFVGGSEVAPYQTHFLIEEIKKHTILPLLIFPGDISQITDEADAVLFLSLISGRNPEYLIGKHVQAVPLLKNKSLEVIPTGYILVENGRETAVQRVSYTKPIKAEAIETVAHTAKAGEYLGMKLIYLEAGSGAENEISNSIISTVKQDLNIPLIVGGGIKNIKQIQSAFNAGADMIVLGTILEEDERFFEVLNESCLSYFTERTEDNGNMEPNSFKLK